MTHGTINHLAENVPAKHERKEMTKDTLGVHVKPVAVRTGLFQMQ